MEGNEKLLDFIVSQYPGITIEQVLSKSRKMEVVEVRHVSMYIIKQSTGMAPIHIGKLFNRDRTSVVHCLQKVEEYRRLYSQYNHKIKSLTKNVQRWQARNNRNLNEN
jgi:chromosomal replication initiator protein